MNFAQKWVPRFGLTVATFYLAPPELSAIQFTLVQAFILAAFVFALWSLVAAPGTQ